MSGYFGVVSKEDCVFDLFCGTDYHSHLGTRRAGLAVYGEDGFNRSIHNKAGGILIRYHHPADFVREGNLLAEIIDPYTTDVQERICAPADGTLFFAHHAQLIAGHSIVFRLIPER